MPPAQPAAFECRPASDIPQQGLRDAFNASFADYLIPLPPLDDALWAAFVQRQGIELALSPVAWREGMVIAFAFVTPREGQRTRIAAMGARPAERGSGAARHLLQRCVEDARHRGQRWIELEAFATNERAQRLYRSQGFAPVCALHGWRSEPGQGLSRDEAIGAVAREDAARWLDAWDRARPEHLPFQVSGAAVAAAPGEVQAWRLGSAQLVFNLAADGNVAVTSLVDTEPEPVHAARLLGALRRRHPDRALVAPPLHRVDGASRAFAAAGWARQPLWQWLLRLPL